MARPFNGTITCAANTNAQRLSSLLLAALGSGGDAGCAIRNAEWTITADAGNSAPLYIGGALVSSTNPGVTLNAGESWTLGAGNVMNSLSALLYWVRSTAASQKFAFAGRVV